MPEPRGPSLRGPLAALGLGVVLAALGCWTSSGNNPQDPASQSELAIVASADTAGFITPCGCTSNQAGGLPRRATYAQGVAEAMPTLLVDVGGAAGGTSAYDVTKFEAILRGEAAMGVQAHNIGGSEAALGPEVLAGLAPEANIPWLTTNLRSRTGKPIGEPLRIVQRAGRRLAILGVLGREHATRDWQWTEPREAIQNTLAQQTESFDSIIVLAYLGEAELRSLATQLPEVDIIIGAGTGQSITPFQVGRTLVTAVSNKGKFLAHLTSLDVQTPWDGRIVELGPVYEDDSEQLRNVSRFRERLAELDYRPEQTGLAPRIPPNVPASFRIAGSESCRSCHEADCSAWDASAHAHAWQTLREQGAHVDAYCQQCHTTGYGLPGGFVTESLTPDRVNVSCESCHGPSQAHVGDPDLPTTYASRSPDRCVTCHDPENSPEFDYTTYWPQIEHGGSVGVPPTRIEPRTIDDSEVSGD